MTYKISLAAINIPEETYPMMEGALRDRKIGQTDLIEQFEKAIAEFVGSTYCIAVSNGTMADAVAVAALKEYMGVKRAIVPALTFIAQPNSVLYNNMRVDFVDVNEDWTINFSDVPYVFLKDSLIFGTDIMGRLLLSSDSIDIEDACEAFGSRYEGKSAGTFGLMGTFSFFPSHTISTGEGGAIVTDIKELDKLCRSIRAHGTGSSDPMEKFHFPNPGFNARLSSIQAVLGITLMQHVKNYVATRRRNFKKMQILGGFSEREGEEIVPHAYPIEFDNEASRDTAMKNLLADGIECRKFFSCIPMEEPHHYSLGKYPIAWHIAHTYLYVPCHQNMTDEDVDYVIDKVLEQKGRVVKPNDPTVLQPYLTRTEHPSKGQYVETKSTG